MLGLRQHWGRRSLSTLLSSRAGQQPLLIAEQTQSRMVPILRRPGSCALSAVVLVMSPLLVTTPGMDNKIIIISHQREDGRFVTSIQNREKHRPQMRHSASGTPYLKLPCHRCTGDTEGGASVLPARGGLSQPHIYILSLVGCRQGVTHRTPGFPL